MRAAKSPFDIHVRYSIQARTILWCRLIQRIYLSLRFSSLHAILIAPKVLLYTPIKSSNNPYSIKWNNIKRSKNKVCKGRLSLLKDGKRKSQQAFLKEEKKEPENHHLCLALRAVLFDGRTFQEIIHRSRVNHADLEHPCIFFGSVYFRIIDSWSRVEVAFGSVLLSYHPNRVFSEGFTLDFPISVLVMRRRRLWGCMNDRMIIFIREAALECCEPPSTYELACDK